MTVEDIAKIAHQANKAYCEALGDTSQTDWEQAPEWQRTSAIKGVEFHLANPDATDSASHDSWLAEKRATGLAYGDVKDAEAKTHPCFLPFDELPKTQQLKDAQFRAIANVFRDSVSV